MEKTQGKFKLVVDFDNNPESPRMWDNICTFTCWGKYKYVGDKHDMNFDECRSITDIKEIIEDRHEVLMMKPLYVYDHGGITISTGEPYDYRNPIRDSSFIGFVYITKEQWNKICGDMEYDNDRLDKCIEGEVETYDKYWTGMIYKYEIYKVETCNLGCEHEELVDSCCGYYDEEDCIQEGISIMDGLYHEEEFRMINS